MRALRSVSVWSGVVLLAAAGCWLAFARLSVPAWGVDEPVYARAGLAYWHGDFGLNPEHPPLGKYLIGASEAAFGSTVGAARLPGALALLGSGLLLWAWLSRVGPRWSGPVAAALTWTLPVLAGFPEALDESPATAAMARAALLEPVAAVLGLAALAAGWWWLRSGRVVAGAACGLLSGLAIAAKLPAGLTVLVPAVAGCLGAGCRPGGVLRRLARTAGHGLLWIATAAAAFAACYLPMGVGPARRNLGRMWQLEHRHGTAGHPILVAGVVRLHAPWWINLAWQRASWGTALTVAAAAAVVAGLLARSGLTAYLAAAALLPATLLAPLTGLALPHYLVLWRPQLIAAATVGAAAAVSRMWRLRAGGRGRPRWAARISAAALGVALAVPAALAGTGSAVATVTLRPTGYAELPALVPDGGTVWLIGDLGAARFYLPHSRSVGYAAKRPPRGVPAAIVVDRGSSLRFGDGGLPRWAGRHGYRHLSTGSLDVWLAPHSPHPLRPIPRSGIVALPPH